MVPVGSQAGARKALSAPAYMAGSSAPISSGVLCIDSAAAFSWAGMTSFSYEVSRSLAACQRS